MMRFHREKRGFRFALLVVGGWIGLVMLVATLSARAEDDSPETRIDRWQNATPQERQAMRDSARSYWRHASSAERSRIRHRLRALRRALPDFSRLERRLLLRRMVEMPKAERHALRERLVSIEQLDVEARAELEDELRGLIAQGTDDLHRMEENLRRWQDMTPEEREALREQAHRFRRMPLEERQRLLDEWVPRESDRGASPDSRSE